MLAVAAAALASGCAAGGQPGASSPAAPVVETPASASPSPAAAGGAPSRGGFVADPQPVPILVYHHVVPRASGPPLLVMSREHFARQMRWLAAHRYQAVTLRRVYDAWRGQALLPPRPVVITFDDGWADQVRNAAPVLRRHHWPAELDLVSGALYYGDPAPSGSLTPEMVQGLLDDGWGLESHTVTHPDLRRLTDAEVRHELRSSRARLEQLFHVPVDFFCFPYGVSTWRLRRAVQSAGYLAATGTSFGAATPRARFSLPRIYCWQGEPDAQFGRRLRRALAAVSD